MTLSRFALALCAGLFVLFASQLTADASSYMAIAKSYNGANPTGWSRKWCAKYVDMVLRKAGYPGGGVSAIGYAKYGRPSRAKVGAIAVMPHHIGFVTAVHKGSVTIISGNHAGKPGHRTVGYGRYPMSRIVTFRMPE